MNKATYGHGLERLQVGSIVAIHNQNNTITHWYTFEEDDKSFTIVDLKNAKVIKGFSSLKELETHFEEQRVSEVFTKRYYKLEFSKREEIANTQVF